jgi:2-methylisocitrate lyase-like PEP mutase family enzyme
MKTTTRLRQLLAGQEIVIAPGAYDAITARLIEHAGFPVAYMTGAGTAASLGYPDFGLVTMTEMVANAATLARSVNIPIIADADTGYGNELNVTRTVREYESRGVAGIHIEDQVAPKRCGHLDGKEIIPADEYVAKIRAAVAARRDQDFLIIARTDARAVVGLDEAIARANAAIDAGADMAFVEAVQTMEELQAVPVRVKGHCLLNVVRAGKTPDIDFGAAQSMGYRLAILPSLLIVAATEACTSVLRKVKETNAPPSSAGSMPVAERFRRMGSDEWSALSTKFRDAAAPKAWE